ncbi:Fe-S cluster assembly sulfur transfer protein SufU [Amedibacterium intestinale]|uniref:Iron-sulfur cluster assembly scaffold protein NifU n=1 Tax=Amedibacterium intestinale TaxID=2583452 RepID=A0A6N4TH59_9FIRM|nr:SUF system NifU family Fe-S cluster assembly protein [Amedibacterium intestinale]BBK21911.1 iron-sulfur cluster assembly scaffold protein NifU [Amedibacterium intestinale]
MSGLMDDPMILRSIIMDHYEYPRNHELTEKEDYKKKHMASESCIDDIYVQAKIEDGIVEDIRFDGVACTISTASTSIMSELLKGKTTQEAKHIIENYYQMIDQKEYDEELLEEAVAFHNVGKQANRIKCATIGWKAMEELLLESEEK